MGRKMFLLSAVLIFVMVFSFASPVGAQMIKEIAVGVFSNAPSQVELDRFYLQYHGPEITELSGPWMTRYRLWPPYEAPEEAVERFGAVKGRYAELWYPSEEVYMDRPLHGYMSQADWGEQQGKSDQLAVMVPAKPTERFYDTNPNPVDGSLVRWISIIAYPEDVSIEEGEEWFLNVHAKEAAKQPGLLKFVSYSILMDLGDKMLEMMMEAWAIPSSDDGRGGGMPGMADRKAWVRVNEYWYRDLDDWRKAVIETPPNYTAPPWGGEYPFVEMVSMFIPYMHDVDFLKGDYVIP